jgi:hypothetical protein
MEHSAQADFHGGLGRKGAWRLPFVFYIPTRKISDKKNTPGRSAPGGVCILISNITSSNQPVYAGILLYLQLTLPLELHL